VEIPVPSPAADQVRVKNAATSLYLSDWERGGSGSFAIQLLCVSGDVRIHIDRTFALDEVPVALAHVGQEQALGKVVVSVA
jgi:NADPH:quinone reductase-like Zn-dependent oxidoreductase